MSLLEADISADTAHAKLYMNELFADFVCAYDYEFPFMEV